MENRRKHQRFRAAIAAEVELESELYEGVTRDLSQTGAAIMVGAPLIEGAKLSLTLLLTEDGIASPDAEPLTLEAEVVWVGEATPDGAMAGLRFATLAPAELQRLQDLLAALSVRPPPRR